jgi:tetratricopeptide (TPR) repeat protein
LLARRDATEALTCYDQALALDPKGTQAWLGKGCALAQLGRPLEAVDCYDAALGMKPHLAQAWVCKGNALRFLG